MATNTHRARILDTPHEYSDSLSSQHTRHSVQWFHNDLGRRSAAQLISGKLSPFLLGGMQRPFCSGDLRTFCLNMRASVSLEPPDVRRTCTGYYGFTTAKKEFALADWEQ